MESLEILNDLFIHELRDLHDAEQQLTKDLPLLAQAAKTPERCAAFAAHLEETKEHARHLEQIFKALGVSPLSRLTLPAAKIGLR